VQVLSDTKYLSPLGRNPMFYELKDIKQLHLEPTSKCNAACPQCARNVEGEGLNPLLAETDLSLADVQKMFPVDFIKQLNSMFMCGSFGDPAAARDAIEIFKYFREVNPTITFNLHSNGGLRSKIWWEELGKVFNSPYDFVVFNLDGLSDTNAIYRKNTDWNKIMENVKAYLATGANAQWSMLVYEHNEHQVQECLNMAKDLGFKRFYSKVSKRLQYTPISFLNYPKNFQNSDQVFTDEISCEAIRTKSIYASADGLILPCCYVGAAVLSQRPYTRMNTLATLGDLDRVDGLRHDISDIVASKSFTNFSDSWDTKPAHMCKVSCSKMLDGGTRTNLEYKIDVWF
jgi:sulfatase maturation enzyme AslB (radical SAM superfamily)